MSSSVDSSGGSYRFSMKVDSVPNSLKVFIDDAWKKYPDNPLSFAFCRKMMRLQGSM
jgi:hypothetical protein